MNQTVRPIVYSTLVALLGALASGLVRELLPQEVRSPHAVALFGFMALPEFLVFILAGIAAPVVLAPREPIRQLLVCVGVIALVQGVVLYGFGTYSASDWRGVFALSAPIAGALAGFSLGALVAIGVRRMASGDRII